MIDNVRLLEELSEDAKFALDLAFVLKRKDFTTEQNLSNDLLRYYRGTLELIGRNIVKPAFDIISGKWLIVLTKPGKRFIAAWKEISPSSFVDSGIGSTKASIR